MYDVSAYSQMIGDRVRMDAYVAALRRCVYDGATVLDLGAGTGVFGLLACRFGAGKVYAIEPNDAIEVARESASDNGFADRMVFLQELSTQVTIPDKADLIVSDLRGVLPLFERHIPSIIDARKRFLAPGGTLIPRADSLWVAPVEASEIYIRRTSPWLGQRLEIDWKATQRRLVNTWTKVRFRPEQLLAKPRKWATLDYFAIEEPDVQGDATWVVEQTGTIHGYLVWFDTELAEGITYSNSPECPETVYSAAFLPLQEPVSLDSGEAITVALRADLVHEDYVWQWNSIVSTKDGSEKARFRQSTFLADVLFPAKYQRKSSTYTPALNKDGDVDAFLLEQMGRSLQLGEIAGMLQAKYPVRYRTWEEALDHAGDLAVKYGK